MGIFHVVTSSNKWPHKSHNLDVIHIVKESISSYDKDVVMVDVVHLSLGFVGIISVCSNLEGKIEAVGLFLRAEYRDELSTFFPH